VTALATASLVIRPLSAGLF